MRLEGGIGDHILGMRLLCFIHKRYPQHKIIGYSDAGGSQVQLEVARMSPFFSEVIPVYQKKKFPTISTWGSLKNIEKKYLEMMHSAEIFFDAWGQTFFLEASRILNIPFYEILSHRPELIVPNRFKIEASKILSPYKGYACVGLDISKHNFRFLSRNKENIFKFIKELLKNPRVIILNFYTSNYKFPHWPRALAIGREEWSARESAKIGQLWNINRRVIPLVDFPISMVAALLKKCCYFIGVDNGIKHLGWALGVPHSYFYHCVHNVNDILRWMPDYERHLFFNCYQQELKRHLSEAGHFIRAALSAE